MNQTNPAACRKVKKISDAFRIFNVDEKNCIVRAGIANGAAIIESIPEICEISGRGSRSVNIIAFQNLHLLPLPL